MDDGLEVVGFEDGDELRRWLESNHGASPGLWVRIYKLGSGVKSVSFDELLELGLCFGWSESARRRGDQTFYLQRFTPRRTRGTTSDRNRRLAARLLAEGRMTGPGLEALGMDGRREST